MLYVSLSKSVGKETEHFNSKREHFMYAVKHLCTNVPSKFCLDMTKTRKRWENRLVNRVDRILTTIIIILITAISALPAAAQSKGYNATIIRTPCTSDLYLTLQTTSYIDIMVDFLSASTYRQ